MISARRDLIFYIVHYIEEYSPLPPQKKNRHGGADCKIYRGLPKLRNSQGYILDQSGFSFMLLF